jgi:hypothetical protein
VKTDVLLQDSKLARRLTTIANFARAKLLKLVPVGVKRVIILLPGESVKGAAGIKECTHQ